MHNYQTLQKQQRIVPEHWLFDPVQSLQSIIRFTAKDLLRHGPGLQGVAFLAQLGTGLFQAVSQLGRVGVGTAWNLSAANMSIGAVNDGQAQFTITVLWSPGHALKRTKGAVGNQKSFVDTERGVHGVISQ
jgi:hypothetical protein